MRDDLDADGATEASSRPALGGPLSSQEEGRFASFVGGQPRDLPRRPERRRPLILLAEDHPQLREVVRRSLADIDCDCIETRGGGEALQLVLERRPDLLLLDIKLPELDGFEVLRGVRLYLNDRETMVLVMTSVDRSDVASLDLGADGFLPKPFEAAQLRAHVRSLLRRVAPGRARR